MASPEVSPFAEPGLPQPDVFVDASDSVRLAVQLTPDTGQAVGSFTVTIKGVGSYVGTMRIAAAISPSVGTGSGAVTLSDAPQARVADAKGTFVGATSLQIKGVVNRSDGSADISVVDLQNHRQYQLKNRGLSAVGAQGAAVSVCRALIADDFETLFMLLAPEVTKGTTAASFAATLKAQPAPKILGISIDGPGTLTALSGNRYYEQPVTVRTATAEMAGKMSFTLEGGRWYFLSADFLH